MRRLAEWLTTRQGSELLASGDVPRVFRIGGRLYPFGARHVRMLRQAAGLPVLRRDMLDPPPLDLAMPDMEELRIRGIKERQFEAKQRVYASAKHIHPES